MKNACIASRVVKFWNWLLRVTGNFTSLDFFKNDLASIRKGLKVFIP